MNKTWGGVEVGYGASNWFQGHYTKPDCVSLFRLPANSLPLRLDCNLPSRPNTGPMFMQQHSSNIYWWPNHVQDSKLSVGEVLKNKTEIFWPQGTYILVGNVKKQRNKSTNKYKEQALLAPPLLSPCFPIPLGIHLYTQRLLPANACDSAWELFFFFFFFFIYLFCLWSGDCAWPLHRANWNEGPGC